MPAFWTAIILSSQVILAADQVPQLDIEPSCKAAANAAVTPERNADACRRDEQQALEKLKQEWGSFAAAERERCTSLSHRGGSPSYVELLTCLELAKSASELRNQGKTGGQIQR